MTLNDVLIVTALTAAGFAGMALLALGADWLRYRTVSLPRLRDEALLLGGATPGFLVVIAGWLTEIDHTDAYPWALAVAALWFIGWFNLPVVRQAGARIAAPRHAAQS